MSHGTSKRWDVLWMTTVKVSVLLRNAPETIRRQLQLNAEREGLHLRGAVQAYHGVYAAADELQRRRAFGRWFSRRLPWRKMMPWDVGGVNCWQRRESPRQRQVES